MKPVFTRFPLLTLTLQFAALLSCAGIASAQQQYLQRHQGAKDVASFARSLMGQVQSKTIDNDVLKSISSMAPQLDRDLKYTGNYGALIRVTIEEQPSVGVKRLVGTPTVVGAAETPVIALANESVKGRVAPGLSPQFTLSGDSYYVWVTRSTKEGELLYAIVPPAAARKSEKEADSLVASEDTRLYVDEVVRARSVARLIGELKREATSATQREAVVRLDTAIAQTDARLKEIEATARFAQAQAESSRQAVAFMEKLQGAVSVSLLLSNAAASDKEAQDKVNQANGDPAQAKQNLMALNEARQRTASEQYVNVQLALKAHADTMSELEAAAAKSKPVYLGTNLQPSARTRRGSDGMLPTSKSLPTLRELQRVP